MIETALKRLGYTQDWLDLKIITEEFLLSQYQQICHSDDNNAEHYRHAAFVQFIDSQSSLTDNQIEKVLQLIDLGPDKYDLHNNRVIALIYSGLLNDHQFHQLSQYKQVLEDPIQKIYHRTKLIRNIKKHGLNEYFEQVTATKDTAVHEHVLSRNDLKPHQIQWFIEYGCNKAVRNIALKKSNKF